MLSIIKRFFVLVEHSLRKEGSLLSGATAADTSVLLGRWQQGEKAVAVVAEVGGCWLSVSSGLCADTSLHQHH